MTFDEYQQKALTTMLGGHDSMVAKTILALGVAGEAGEVADKWKKILAYQNGEVTSDDVAELAKEMGDVLWYLAVLAESLGLKLGDIAKANNAKLASRQTRGVIRGRGDNR
ncbi:MAG TPA: nucleoside triphosphate pyrophosphohydrolase family protein [Candidatus Saccharimonadales bacterium]